MRMYINVPYTQKDHAKKLGARWDSEARSWYITELQDFLLFERWFDVDKKPVVKPDLSSGVITLEDFLKKSYGGFIGLTRRSAQAFGIPYPLESGWAKKYAGRTAQLSKLSVGKKTKAKKPKKLKIVKEAEPPAVFVPLCECDALPWEDCIHTETAAHNAMKEMLA